MSEGFLKGSQVNSSPPYSLVMVLKAFYLAWHSHERARWRTNLHISTEQVVAALYRPRAPWVRSRKGTEVQIQ